MSRSPGSIVVGVLAAVWLLGSGCGSTNVGLNRSFSEYGDALEYDDAMSPESFVDRLGEPDEWKNEGEGDRLRMTAIWYCLDNEYREIQWRMMQRERGPQSWVVQEDVRRECDKK
ncbi:MAG: hypothetical protein DHS20C21_18000 [Gemmatimonadota bacterium]|nr:MAG: hypothetical protein DHS20C21_18000 [Gemmatimonadota bacterium]